MAQRAPQSHVWTRSKPFCWIKNANISLLLKNIWISAYLTYKSYIKMKWPKLPINRKAKMLKYKICKCKFYEYPYFINYNKNDYLLVTMIIRPNCNGTNFWRLQINGHFHGSASNIDFVQQHPMQDWNVLTKSALVTLC